MSDYAAFLASKAQDDKNYGFDPEWVPEFLFPFQRDMVRWSTRKGHAALFEDCGLGKTPQQLVWAENVYRHTGRPVLLVAPLALTPFMGVGSEVYASVLAGRRALGVELKPTYYRQAVANVAAANAGVVREVSLFDEPVG